ncbi:MAG TPA: protoporphyrinogen oxidase [Candidatus Polarisedimenticolia bacterium]
MTGSGSTGAGGGLPWRVVVIGAGVAGLACARRLQQQARADRRPLDLTLLEAAGRPGGVIETEHHDDFLVEGGPDCFISEKPWALDLCRELGLADEIVGTNQACRRSFVLRRGRLIAIPEGFQMLAPARLLPFALSPILSVRGKLRVACDLILPRGPEVPDESLASFVRRRFGHEALERMAQPLVAGIYNADPERLSVRATFPRFLDLERARRSVILGLIGARHRAPAGERGTSGARYSLFVTLRRGMGLLIDRLVAGLAPGTLRLRTPVASIERGADAARTARPGEAPAAGTAAGAERPGRWVVTTEGGERIPADAAVLAMPAAGAARLVRTVDAGLTGELASIPYGTSATVSLAYRRSDIPRRLDGFGFVVPRAEKRSLIACTFSSVKFPQRAPADAVLLRAFLGGPAVEEGDPELLTREAREQLLDIMGIEAPPLLARSFIWPKAMAQYEVGHLDKVETIEARLGALPGLGLAGNGLRGVGIPDCIKSGDRAAERLSQEVTTS